jgi:hypothetical protein
MSQCKKVSIRFVDARPPGLGRSQWRRACFDGSAAGSQCRFGHATFLCPSRGTLRLLYGELSRQYAQKSYEYFVMGAILTGRTPL